MKNRTERMVVNEYLLKADGDPLKALKRAVRDMGVYGYCISAGFVRAAPYSDTAPPHAVPPFVDIPAPDDDDE